ncbi:MAG: hypothetical protein CMH83_22050 [Nocardioides sp.]|nr:hypothetical protein [Nocardioides sp.]
MRGDWDDAARRLGSAIVALDLGDVITIGEERPVVRTGLLGLRTAPSDRPRRWAQVTAAQNALVAEVVGSTSFGGTWEMSPETERSLEKQGWERPWSEQWRDYQREANLGQAHALARALLKALRTLGCEVADLEVTRSREEPDPGDY